MLILLRILFGAAMFFAVREAWAEAQANPMTGDLTNAYYTALCVILAIANAVVWAPWFGSKIADPITGVITRSTYYDQKNRVLQLIHWAESRGLRRCTVFGCFLEGIRHPNRPAHYVIGLNNARPGSWFEKVFARELWRFDNAQNCLRAYRVLMRHRINPRPHHNPEVNLLLISMDHEVKPDPERLPVPKAPPVTNLRRNKQIQLFEMEEPARDSQSQGETGNDEKAVAINGG